MEDIADWAAVVVAGLALAVAVWAARESRAARKATEDGAWAAQESAAAGARSAKAAEESAKTAEEALAIQRAQHAAAQPKPVEWVITWQGFARLAVRNIGTGTAVNVTFDPEQAGSLDVPREPVTLLPASRSVAR